MFHSKVVHMSSLSLFEPFNLSLCGSSLATLTNITDFNQDWLALSNEVGQALVNGEQALTQAAPYFAERTRSLVEPIAFADGGFVVKSNEYLDEVKTKLALSDETIMAALKALSPLNALLGEQADINFKASKVKGKYDIVLSSDNVLICIMVLEFIKTCPKLAKLNLRLSSDRDPNFSMQIGQDVLTYEDILVYVEPVDQMHTHISLICPKLKDKITEEQFGTCALTMLRYLFGDVIGRIILECSTIEVSFDIPAKLQAQLDKVQEESDSDENVRPVHLKDFYRNYISHGGKVLTKETDLLFITNYRDHNASAKANSSTEPHNAIFEIDALNTFSPSLDQETYKQDLEVLKALGVTPITLALSMKQADTNEPKMVLSRMENNQLLKDIERFINRSKCENLLKVVGYSFAPSKTNLYLLAFDYDQALSLIKSYSTQSKLSLSSLTISVLGDTTKGETITL